MNREALIVKRGSRVVRRGVGRLLALALVVALAACSSTPKQPRIEREARAPDAAPGVRRGGYYLDDGPGADPPPDIDRIPDAQPRAEPLHRAANRPYAVFGREYVPIGTLAPYKARGIASWYGRRYHGQRTAIGEIYDMYAMSAAHPTLPIPSYARVTNLANGRAVTVRVNDRGPFLGNRLIDLSYAAAYRLGMLSQGSATVEVELVLPGEASRPTVAAAAQPAARTPDPEPASTGGARAVDGARIAVPLPPLAESAGAVFVQLGAFAARENAELFRSQLASQVAWLGDALRIESRDGLHRVHAGPYQDRIEALAAAQRIRESIEIAPVLVVK